MILKRKVNECRRVPAQAACQFFPVHITCVLLPLNAQFEIILEKKAPGLGGDRLDAPGFDAHPLPLLQLARIGSGARHGNSAREYMDFRWLVRQGKQAEFGSEVGHSNTRRGDSKPVGRFGHVRSDFACVQERLVVGYDLKVRRRFHHQTRSAFKLQLHSTLGDLHTSCGQRITRKNLIAHVQPLNIYGRSDNDRVTGHLGQGWLIGDH